MNVTKTLCHIIVLAILMACFSYVLKVKPPFSSPDEDNHLPRAYGIINGYFSLKPVGRDGTSGAYVDSSVTDAVNIFRKKIFEKDTPNSYDEGILEMKKLNWSGINIEKAMPNLAFYSPFVYLPQSLSLLVAKMLNFDFYRGYIIANFAIFISCLIIIFLSYRLYPIPPLALTLISIPMSVFQMMSPTIDGISISLTILSMSIFMKLTKDNSSKKYLFLLTTLSISIFSATSSRANLIFMPLLILWLYFCNRKKSTLSAFFIVAIASVGWTLFTVSTVHDSSMARHPGYTNSEIISFYLHHPMVFFTVFWSTVNDPDLIRYYYETFIGRLGSLDAPIKEYQRVAFSALLIAYSILSIILCDFKKFEKKHAFIAFMALSSAFLIFPALLSQWTKFPADVIDGIQGRYFIIPAILLCYAIPINNKLNTYLIFSFIIIYVYSSSVVHESLKDRYLSKEIFLPYNKDTNSIQNAVPVPSSPPLEYNFKAPDGEVNKISILLANYNNTAKGIINLTVCSDKNCVEHKIDNKNMLDNTFFSFSLGHGFFIRNNMLNLRLSFKPYANSPPIAAYIFNSSDSKSSPSIKIKLDYN